MLELVSINGNVTPPEKAQISVFDRGFLYGDGIYEVARSYNRIFFGLEDHIDRLLNSAQRIQLEIGMSKDELISEIYRIYKHSEINDAYMRIVITRGEGRINLDPTQTELSSNVVIFIQKLPKIDPKIYDRGISLLTASVFRNPKKSLDPNIKSGNYLNNIMALGEAKKKGADDALMTNREGEVTEGTTWNIYAVINGEIVTPPDDADILRGITRKTLRELCANNKLKWIERPIKLAELVKADEVFTTGSVKEVVPVSQIDGQKIKNCPGAITKLLQKLYKGYIDDYCSARIGKYS
ncbi:MAG: aminotransferase class IV [Oligoflexia bacterium]|nr:aminotransferase class IV [Oligoflexia bacterium]